MFIVGRMIDSPPQGATIAMWAAVIFLVATIVWLVVDLLVQIIKRGRGK